MIIQFISHTHNELFNSENILLQTTKNVFIRCIFSYEFEGWLGQISDILWVTYKLFSVSVAELGRVFFGSSDLVKFVHNQRLIEFVMVEEEVKERKWMST